MKFHFENLDYQTKAVEAVTSLFNGQVNRNRHFTLGTISTLNQGDYSQYGVGNLLNISDNDISDNLRQVQDKNNIFQEKSTDSLDFNIEMETGTGKTYVYLKTIFELNKEYGFTKFIIVVPNVAIKEGVNKFIQMSKDHFKQKYNANYNSFVYDSSNLDQVRVFANDSNIQIMIINIDSFNKSFKDPEKENKANIIHRENDKLEGRKPIEFIQETNPIVIIDEPQSVVTTDKANEAIRALNPLCTLRYSATHKEIQNLVYKLDAVDAYEQNLVKKIEVAGLDFSDDFNTPYIRLVSVSNKNSKISASLELDMVNKTSSVKRAKKQVKKGDDLAEITKRTIYEGYIVDEISCKEGDEFISFTPKGDVVRLGEHIGGVNDLEIKRVQIRKTIEEHLDKELKLKSKGIKVLSLFFIDKVSNYRQYDDDGNPRKGRYAKIFEEEYEKLIKKDKYATLDHTPASEVHNGYFSKDKKGKFKQTTKRLNSQDEDTFNLIMKDKEKLLSFNTPLKFIFSHSALREGWDNPNVFQVCTLNETKSSMKKRQEIGRGLRLCVNQNGERVEDKNGSINVLTIMANEYYEDFARELQKEMEDDLNIKFGVINRDFFDDIVGRQNSLKLFNEFKRSHYINKDGQIKPKLKEDIKNNCLDIPERLEEYRFEIIDKIQGVTREIPIVNKNNKRKVKVKDKCFNSNLFGKFWDKINQKTTYSVDFSTEELIKQCIRKLEGLTVHKLSFTYTKSDVKVERSGITQNETKAPSIIERVEEDIPLPDIVEYLQNETFLTRGTIIKILTKSNTLEEFKKNPQEYMEKVAKIIKSTLNKLLIENIQYTKLDDSYNKELFVKEDIEGYLGKDLYKTTGKNSIYNYVKYDSDNECRFARQLDRDEEICMYTKLPVWFKIKTPIGNYNPDWGICFNKDDNKGVYVIETKANTDSDELRGRENDKISCGKKHFKALDVKFLVEDSYTNLKKDIQ